MRAVRCHVFASRVAFAASVTALAPGEASAQTERVVTLADVESAVRRQPQVLVASAGVDAAAGLAQQARAPLLPQIVGTARYTRGTGNFTPRLYSRNKSIAGGTTLAPSYDYYQFEGDITQLIYDFGQTTGRYNASERSVDAQKDALQTTLVQVMFSVRRAYFNAGATKDLVGVAQETLDDQKRHLEQVQGFVTAGTQPAIARAQQLSEVATAEVQLVNAQNTYEIAKAQLNQAAGLTRGTDYDVAPESMAPIAEEDDPLETLVARAFAARPEMAMLEHERQAQADTVSAANGGFGPTLSASAGASEVGLALDQLIPNWYAGVAMSWPVFQGGFTQGQVRQAEAQLHSIESQKAGEELQIRFDVDSSRLAVRAAKASMPAAERAQVSARERLTLAEQRYATGVGNIIELGDAQTAYASAAAQVVASRYALNAARAQLLAALGRT